MWIKTSGDSTNETWIPTPTLRFRRSGGARFFLLRSFLSLGCLHFHIFRRHCIMDGHLIAHFNVAVHLRAGVARELEALLFRALLHHDHAVVYFSDWSGNLVILDTKRHTAEHQT